MSKGWRWGLGMGMIRCDMAWSWDRKGPLETDMTGVWWRSGLEREGGHEIPIYEIYGNDDAGIPATDIVIYIYV